MQEKLGLRWRVAAVLCLLAGVGPGVFAQAEGELTARRRLLSDIGPGLRAVKRGSDKHTYVLASPTPGLMVFDDQGQRGLSLGGGPGARRAGRGPLPS